MTGGGTANGTLVDLYACNGSGAQVWQPQSNGSLVNPQSGACLDDTGFSDHPRHPGADLELLRRRQPVLDAAVTQAVSPKDQTHHPERSRGFAHPAPP